MKNKTLLKECKCIHCQQKLEQINNPSEALLRAEKIAKESNCSVLIIGSIYLVGEIMNYVINRDSLDLYDMLTIHESLK